MHLFNLSLIVSLLMMASTTLALPTPNTVPSTAHLVKRSNTLKCRTYGTGGNSVSCSCYAPYKGTQVEGYAYHDAALHETAATVRPKVEKAACDLLARNIALWGHKP